MTPIRKTLLVLTSTVALAGGAIFAQQQPKPAGSKPAPRANPKKAPEAPKPKTNNAAEATPADKIRALPGFKVELLYTVPAETQGSWVAMCTDHKGRLIVCDQYGALYRVTPPALGTTEGMKIEPIPAQVGAANGLVWAFDALYVVVNNYTDQSKSGVYRVTDTNGDDTLDKAEFLRNIPGGGDHSPHAAVLAPDGKSIYIVVGNKSELTKVDSSRVPMLWGEDHLLPRMPDGRGFMRDKLAPGGNIYSMSPDGKTWELVATGFRNQYDAAFNKDGELFTYDADMEYDFNTSWYRPTRVNHVISGAEFGWRNGAGKWPEWYEDSFGAVINIGPGSPTGVTFGYDAKFPAKYQDALFINDWSWGKMYAIHMQPDGSSYTATKEEFLSGSPLPLTDSVVRKEDGALYFAIGGRKTQSGLYRVTYTGTESTAPAVHNPGTPEQVAARELRHKLESFHGKKLTEVEQIGAMEGAWNHLGSDDRAIRSAARTVLEHLPVKQWQKQALAEQKPERQIPALLALVRATSVDPFHRKPTDAPEDKALQAEILSALKKIDFAKLPEWQKLAMLRTYAVCFVRMGKPTEEQRLAAIAQLTPHFPAKTIPVSYDLCMALSYLQDPSLAAKAVPLLATAATQEEQIEYARSLRMLKAGWTPELRTKQFEWLLRAANYRGGASFVAFIQMIRTDAIASLSDAEKTQLKDILEKKPEVMSPLAALSAGLQGRTKVKEWKVEDLASKAEQSMKGRNFEQGRKMFGTVACFACHRFGNEGGMVGPDLTSLASRFGPRDILVSIIEPSKEVSDQFAPTVVKTLDGDQVIGRIVNLNGDRVMVNTDLFDPNQQTAVDRNNVKSMETSKVSLMPEGLVDYLKEEEIFDLLAYLIARGDPKHEVFQK
ncbi:c-type cytochrome [Humisphaera borealis]|uniref:C-type cytochrome n=1 Tax=Humisphaera borealis TaxID=2807512 RepID=A0A7M2WYM9_9BACT|nr:c-type cytochrome [Humisphaera borealis]QOV90608.1 c-type cytochrome [Humisphaera borealis]